MDTLSHGLWGSIAFGRDGKKMFWLAFLFGILPDLLSFGLFFAARILGMVSGPDWAAGPPDPSTIPSYVHAMYDVTHSLVVAAVTIGAVWFARRKPFLPMLAWPLHILVDIPTHSSAFFPTPFLWPVSDFTINGTSWGQPLIFFPNVVLLAASYMAWMLRKRRINHIK